jgi:hypothetical protein
VEEDLPSVSPRKGPGSETAEALAPPVVTASGH